MTRGYGLSCSISAGMVLAAMIYTIAGNAQGSAPTIHLKGFHFSPGNGQAPQIPPGLMIAGYARDQRGYYLVQFQGPVEQSWKDELTALGADIIDYIPEFAFKVRMNPAEAARAEQLDSVLWVGVFHPAYKLSPDLIRNGTSMYEIRMERGADFGLTTAAVATTGAQILSRDGGILIVAADPAQIEAIARVLDVAWVQNYRMLQKHNEYAGGIIMGANTANSLGYNGSTQTIAVADTGLGTGIAATAHADIAQNRIVNIFNWPGAAGGCFQTVTDDGAIDADSGHGTHTTVSAVGASGGYGRGVAPGAKLVFQAVENYATISFFCSFLYGYPNGYYLTGLPADLNPLYQQAYNAGARIHSNSWGGAVAGDYDINSANTDAFVWNHRDMVVTFSAGNEGKDANSDGVVDNDSMSSPGTAKNVITIGASENDRATYPCDTSLTYTECSNQGGSNFPIIVTYGTGFGFPANPVKDDLSVGNSNQMAAFSSRGPTDDGRIKPDVVAPGTYVLSGYSDMYQQQYDSTVNPVTGGYQYDGWAYPESRLHKYLGGTSMSNPLVAGGAAVVRDYYAQARNVANASAALVKATIINSAVDLLDENNDGVNDNYFPVPNSHEGWGRVDLATATDGRALYVDTATGVGTGQTAAYTAAAAGGALKITLVWSDYPSTESASVNLVNDLDLRVTAPNGTEVYQGNAFSGGWSQTGGSPDRRNNVENVYIQNAVAGNYSIEVRGYSVPSGPQLFALVVRGANSFTIGTPPPEPPPPPPSSPEMHVGNLTGYSLLGTNGRSWVAGVSTFVHDANEQPVAGATVTGSWSKGYTGTGTCITGTGSTAGFCAMTTGSISTKKGSVTFTVKSITLAGYTYKPTANHDTSGDSNGTTIVVTRP